MWKTSLKTAVLQPFTSNLIFLSTVILTIALSWQIRFFPEFLVKYNHRIQGKKVVRMPITEEFVKHRMEQNAAMLAQNAMLSEQNKIMAEQISQLTKTVEFLNQTI